MFAERVTYSVYEGLQDLSPTLRRSSILNVASYHCVPHRHQLVAMRVAAISQVSARMEQPAIMTVIDVDIDNSNAGLVINDSPRLVSAITIGQGHMMYTIVFDREPDNYRPAPNANFYILKNAMGHTKTFMPQITYRETRLMSSLLIVSM